MESKVVACALEDNLITCLADHILSGVSSWKAGMDRIAVVFGGHRPGLFLQDELARRIKEPFFPPRFFSMDELVEETVSRKEVLTKVSDLDACYMIYSIARQKSPKLLEQRESFAAFLPWAQEMYSFIEQVDLALVAEDALRNIQANARIGYDVPKEVNLLLEDIIAIRREFHKELKLRRMYSRGFLYLTASEVCQGISFGEFERIYFCGFFYLHESEKRIIKTFFDRGQGVLMFQGDEDEWSVLKECARVFSSVIKPQGKQLLPVPNVHFYRGHDTQTQVGLVKSIMGKIADAGDSVIVLPDPKALVPLLSEISSLTADFNVSLGYPAQRTSLYSLFDGLFRAQDTRKEHLYYAKEYLAALSHPILKNLAIIDSALTRVLVHKIEEALSGVEKSSLAGSLFIGLDDIASSHEISEMTKETFLRMKGTATFADIEETLSQLHRLAFGLWEKVGTFKELGEALECFAQALVEKSFLEYYPPNLKVLERLFAIAEEMRGVLFSDESFPREELLRIFLEKLGGEIISFSGSPLKGLQILGLLETRSLYFKHVIVMDVNESVLPALRIYEPLIPRDVMVCLGIDRLEKEEQIQRYQLMRLISGAESAHLIYAENFERERSRLIEELVWRQEQDSGKISSESIPLAGFSLNVLPKQARVVKTEKMIAFLKEKEYSASSVNMYLHCPLKFYYHYVLGLKEKEDLLEEPEQVDIGTFVHLVLEKVYRPYEGRAVSIDQDFRKHFSSVYEMIFEEHFARKMKADAFLLKTVFDFRFKRFLEAEERRAGIKRLVRVESDFRESIQTQSGVFKFICKVDRIDELADGSMLVLDYKTGGTDLLPRSLAKLRIMENTRVDFKKNIRSFQLPLYLLCMQKQSQAKEINAGFYNLKESRIGFFPGKREMINRSAILDLCIEALGSLLAEITDLKTDFVADETDARLCRSCPFFLVCR